MKIGQRIFTHDGTIEWEIVDAMTGRARRITPAPSGPAVRRPTAMERYFTVEVSHDPRHGMAPRDFMSARDAIDAALIARGPGSTDAVTKWAHDKFKGLPPSLITECVDGWLRRLDSTGARSKPTTT